MENSPLSGPQKPIFSQTIEHANLPLPILDVSTFYLDVIAKGIDKNLIKPDSNNNISTANPEVWENLKGEVKKIITALNDPKLPPSAKELARLANDLIETKDFKKFNAKLPLVFAQLHPALADMNQVRKSSTEISDNANWKGMNWSEWKQELRKPAPIKPPFFDGGKTPSGTQPIDSGSSTQPSLESGEKLRQETQELNNGLNDAKAKLKNLGKPEGLQDGDLISIRDKAQNIANEINKLPNISDVNKNELTTLANAITKNYDSLQNNKLLPSNYSNLNDSAVKDGAEIFFQNTQNFTNALSKIGINILEPRATGIFSGIQIFVLQTMLRDLNSSLPVNYANDQKSRINYSEGVMVKIGNIENYLKENFDENNPQIHSLQSRLNHITSYYTAAKNYNPPYASTCIEELSQAVDVETKKFNDSIIGSPSASTTQNPTTTT